MKVDSPSATIAKQELTNDPLLKDVPTVEGYKVLTPCILYSKVGQGGFGAVYRARHVKLDLEVGVKCMLGTAATNTDQFIRRFEREAKLAARVNHSNLVRVFDVDHMHGVHYMVMEYVEGETAGQRVKRKGPLELEEAVAIVLASARGLAAAHAKGVVHRDIKPDNILISKRGEVKLADLGLGQLHDPEGGEDAMTMSLHVIGTPRYMPPEQWENLASVGPPGDVWALGTTLHFLLAGEHTLAGQAQTSIVRQVCMEGFSKISDKVAGVPEALVEIARKCTAISPQDRYPTARELVGELEKFVRAHELRETLADSGGETSAADACPPPPEVVEKVRSSLSTLGVGDKTQVQTAAIEDMEEIERTVALAEAEPAPQETPAKAKKSLSLFILLAGAIVSAGAFFALGGAAGNADGSTATPVAESSELVAQTPVSLPSEVVTQTQPQTQTQAQVAATAKPLTIEGFEHVQENAQGYDEYRHTTTGLVFVSLPGGTFLMGGLLVNEQQPPHNVTPDPFLIAKYELRQSAWSAVMSDRPLQVDFEAQVGDDLPVVNVSWEDCSEFCARTGLQLPTEAQWEYACRADSTTLFAFGDAIAPAMVNYNRGSSTENQRDALKSGALRTVDVDLLTPNGFGLHQMHGNAAEWCADAFDPRFYRSPAAGERNPISTAVDPDSARNRILGSVRALRGGSFVDGPERCHSAWRDGLPARMPLHFAGFRPVRSLAAPPAK